MTFKTSNSNINDLFSTNFAGERVYDTPLSVKRYFYPEGFLLSNSVSRNFFTSWFVSHTLNADFINPGNTLNLKIPAQTIYGERSRTVLERYGLYYLKLKLSTLLLLGLGLTGLHAQQAIPASGGNASGSGGSVSYSVGQMVYTTNTGTNGSVAQGVQQPYEISVTTGLEEANGINLKYTAYPNPATDLLILKIDASTTLSIQSLSYQLYDINGILLESKKLTGNSITISMANLASATYFLKVVNGQKELKTFTIIKN